MLSVIIVNYNVKYFLEQCLYSVFKAGKGIVMEVIVVDNNSTDGSAHYIQAAFPRVRYHISKENLGFSKACNYGLQLSQGDYILFLNPDTILPEDCLEKCMAFLNKQENAGALGIRMIDGSGNFLKESKRGNPTLLNSFFKLCGLSALIPDSAFFSGYYMAHLNEHKTAPVKILSGAFMMMSKKTLDTCGSFDEQFFMYGEDIDLSYRIQKAGFSNYYFADASIIHFKGESTQKESYKYVHTFYNAMRIFIKKHYKGGMAFIYRYVIEAAIFLGAVISLISKKTGSFFRQLGKIVLPAKKGVYIKSRALILTGSPESAKEAEEIAKKAGFEIEIGGTLEIKVRDTTPLVFCEGNSMSFKEIIEIWGENKMPQKMIHAAESKSIVGSPEKNNSGQAISFTNTA